VATRYNEKTKKQENFVVEFQLVKNELKDAFCFLAILFFLSSLLSYFHRMGA